MPDDSPVSQERRERVRAVLGRRLGSVIAVAEAVRRRHNTSAILRSAEAFGLHEVHLVTSGFKASKGAARGAERWLDIHRFATIGDSIARLRERGFKVFVADFADDAFTPETVPVDEPFALVFGAEMSGVSDEARALSDGAVMIPMEGLTSSLNVSAAAACILQRVVPRRRAFTGGGDLDEARQEAYYAAWLAREEQARAGMKARLSPPEPG